MGAIAGTQATVSVATLATPRKVGVRGTGVSAVDVKLTKVHLGFQGNRVNTKGRVKTAANSPLEDLYLEKYCSVILETDGFTYGTSNAPYGNLTPTPDLQLVAHYTDGSDEVLVEGVPINIATPGTFAYQSNRQFLVVSSTQLYRTTQPFIIYGARAAGPVGLAASSAPFYTAVNPRDVSRFVGFPTTPDSWLNDRENIVDWRESEVLVNRTFASDFLFTLQRTKTLDYVGLNIKE